VPRHCQRRRPNSSSPVSPSRWSGQLHTRQQRSPEGLNHRPVHVGVSVQWVRLELLRMDHRPTLHRFGHESGVAVAGFGHRGHGADGRPRERAVTQPAISSSAAPALPGAPSLSPCGLA
jgi:hypothetical protein